VATILVRESEKTPWHIAESVMNKETLCGVDIGATWETKERWSWGESGLRFCPACMMKFMDFD